MSAINFILSKNISELINIQTTGGETALMKAAEYGTVQMITILLQAGSNLQIQNNQGRTAEMLAGSS